MLAEHNGATGTVLIDYVHGGGQMIVFLHDRLSVRAVITDGQGGIQGEQSHLPFGEELGTSGEQEKHRLTSYERDTETNSDYAVNRHYIQGVGRFSRPDALTGTGNAPRTLNRYSYAIMIRLMASTR